MGQPPLQVVMNMYMGRVYLLALQSLLRLTAQNMFLKLQEERHLVVVGVDVVEHVIQMHKGH